MIYPTHTHPFVGEPIKKLLHRIGEVNKSFDVGGTPIYLVFVAKEPFKVAEPYRAAGKKNPALKRGLGPLSRIQQICLQVEYI